MNDYIKINWYEYKILEYIKDLWDKVKVNITNSSSFIDENMKIIVNKREIYIKT